MDTNDEDDPYHGERLHFAAQDGDLGRVKRFLSEGCDINAFDELGKTPLHYAVEKERFEVAQYLIEQGADVNAHHEPSVGNTPLAEIAGNCSLRIAKLLVDAGADPTITGWMQINALHRAKDRKRGDGPQVYELLVRASKRRHG